MKEIKVVGAAIREGNKILAAQRSLQMGLAYKWEFAGGKIEDGESHEEALKREVLEELGVKIKVHKYIATGQSRIDGKLISLYVYEAEIVEGLPIAKEHVQIRWIDISKLTDLDWAEADIPAYEKLVSLYGTQET